MILFVCTKCTLILRVMSLDETEVDNLLGRGSPFWPDRFECPYCTHRMEYLPEVVAGHNILERPLQDLTAQEAFAAFNGLGLPHERHCELSHLEELLHMGVKRVVGKNIPGVSRVLVDYLELADGTKVYFGAGADGAVVYRITKLTSYVDNIPSFSEEPE